LGAKIRISKNKSKFIGTFSNYTNTFLVIANQLSAI
jgi:hypothetical protein